MGMVKSNTVAPLYLIKHSQIARSILERHKGRVSGVRGDFTFLLLSEREVRPRCMSTRVHRNPKHVCLSVCPS